MKVDFLSKSDAFKPSKKLLNLISYIENNSDTKVTIKIRDEYNQYPNKAFYSEEETGKVSLHIATELFEDLDNLEQSIAHEAGHALLSKVKKYPSVSLNTDNYYKKININTIRNAFEDILINILLKSYGFNSHGKSFYTSLNSEIYSLKNRMDPYFEKNEELKEAFIFNRIILALGYYHMIETLQGKREILQIYLDVMKEHFPVLYEDAEKCLFIGENKTIIPKHRFKEALELAFKKRNLIQYVTISETIT